MCSITLFYWTLKLFQRILVPVELLMFAFLLFFKFKPN